MLGYFSWEHKGKDYDLDKAYGQLLITSETMHGRSDDRSVAMQRYILTLLLIGLVLSACSLTSNSGNFYAWNYPAAIDSGGLVIQIGRVLIAEKNAFDDEFLSGPYFQDKPVIVELIFVIKNNSGQTISVYPDQALVAVGDEQIDLYEAVVAARIGDYVGGEILPGITKIGGMWFGLRRTSLDQVKNMSIIISAPYDIYMNDVGPEYHFRLDLSERKSDPMPDELK